MKRLLFIATFFCFVTSFVHSMDAEKFIGDVYIKAMRESNRKVGYYASCADGKYINAYKIEEDRTPSAPYLTVLEVPYHQHKKGVAAIFGVMQLKSKFLHKNLSE